MVPKYEITVTVNHKISLVFFGVHSNLADVITYFVVFVVSR